MATICSIPSIYIWCRLFGLQRQRDASTMTHCRWLQYFDTCKCARDTHIYFTFSRVPPYEPRQKWTTTSPQKPRNHSTCAATSTITYISIIYKLTHTYMHTSSINTILFTCILSSAYDYPDLFVNIYICSEFSNLTVVRTTCWYLLLHVDHTYYTYAPI